MAELANMKVEREIKDRFALMARNEKMTASQFLESLLEQRMREHMLDQVKSAYANLSDDERDDLAAEVEQWDAIDADWPES
ncbi:MAG: hypothetical protein WAS05_10090 [Candidatus Nanopelagicales bacterium]